EVFKCPSCSVRCLEFGTRRRPVQLEPLGRSRALQLDPAAAVAHRPPSRDLRAHDLSIEPDRGFEISDSNSRIEEFHHARVTEPSVFTLRGTCATRVGSPSEA